MLVVVRHVYTWQHSLGLGSPTAASAADPYRKGNGDLTVHPLGLSEFPSSRNLKNHRKTACTSIVSLSIFAANHRAKRSRRRLACSRKSEYGTPYGILMEHWEPYKPIQTTYMRSEDFITLLVDDCAATRDVPVAAGVPFLEHDADQFEEKTTSI
ncbi:hypothetical protein NM688_g205 [Phlebia brevispora]|uniref:Uncharacterized protein n=1 Tax=Phlebia brevispora TaxID=194682 RepID=A0ACC1TEW0_9APHY|nr:hypothetical protein NM688_g205 [Phlebia brevispora]